MDSIGDKEENNSFSVPSIWGRQPFTSEGPASYLCHCTQWEFQLLMNRWNCKPCEIFTLNFANSLYFISHTGISSPTHTPLSLARTYLFPQAAEQGGQGSCSCLPPAIPVTDGPHCHTTPQLLLLQPVLFCDWSFLFLKDQCDFSQPHTVCSVFSRQKLENNN